MESETVVSSETLEDLKKRGGDWAAFRNEVMDSASFGQVVCLKVGPDCTHKTPPPHAPDGAYGLGWKYLFIGMVDIETGRLKPKEALMGWFVYMLENSSKTKLYTGMTNNLERRVEEHNGVGGAKATRAGRPWSLVYTERFEDKSAALKREAHIKRLCHSAKLRLAETQRKTDA